MQLTFLRGRLPEEVTVNGKTYSVYTDFRRWVQLEVLLFEKRDFLLRLPELLRLCYPVLPDTIEEAIAGIASFYSGGTFCQRETEGVKTPPAYSFLQDEALIYAGFYQQYGIDLLTERMHWWQFKALLSGFSEQTQLAQVMQFRTVDLSKVKNEEEKQFYRRMKALYRLPDVRTEEEREAAVAVALAQLF